MMKKLFLCSVLCQSFNLLAADSNLICTINTDYKGHEMAIEDVEVSTSSDHVEVYPVGPENLIRVSVHGLDEVEMWKGHMAINVVYAKNNEELNNSAINGVPSLATTFKRDTAIFQAQASNKGRFMNIFCQKK